MIVIIPTSGDTYNVIGTEDGMFVLQGNLTLDQLKELKAAVDEALEEVPA